MFWDQLTIVNVMYFIYVCVLSFCALMYDITFLSPNNIIGSLISLCTAGYIKGHFTTKSKIFHPSILSKLFRCELLSSGDVVCLLGFLPSALGREARARDVAGRKH